MENLNEKPKESSWYFIDILRIIKKNIVLAISIILITLGIGLIYTFGIKNPVYKSTAQVYVVVPSSYAYAIEGSYDPSDSIKYTHTVATIIKGNVILSPIATKYDMTYQELLSKTETTVSDYEFIINISVYTGNKFKSRDIANDIANAIVNAAKNGGLLKFIYVNDGYIEISSYAEEGIYSSPNRMLYSMLSVLVGIGLAAIIIFIKEFASTKYKTREELEELNYSIIGTIYYDKKLKIDNPNDWLLKANEFYFDSYNRLYTNIRYANVDNQYRVIMVTSTVSGELKTAVAANLAHCIANDNKKVALIDLDTRKPQIHRVFEVQMEDGLVDYFDNVISRSKLFKSTYLNVDVITIGQEITNPQTFFGSDKLKNFINTLRFEYDYVIIDTPPVLDYSDATVISSLVDGVLYNVAIDYTSKRDVKLGIQALNNVGANIIGLNITKADFKRKHSFSLKEIIKKKNEQPQIQAPTISTPEADEIDEKLKAEVLNDNNKEEVINQENDTEEEIVEIQYVDEYGNEIEFLDDENENNE